MVCEASVVMCLCYFFRLKLQQNCPFNYLIISSVTITAFELSLFLEHSSIWMAFNYFIIELLLTQLTVLLVVSLPGPHYKPSTSLTHCLPYGTCWWVNVSTGPIAAYSDVPFGSLKLINHHFKLVWLNPVLIINLDGLYLLYFFSFSVVLLAVTDMSVLFLNSAISNPQLMSCTFPMRTACIFQFELLLRSSSSCSLLLSPQL